MCGDHWRGECCVVRTFEVGGKRWERVEESRDALTLGLMPRKGMAEKEAAEERKKEREREREEWRKLGELGLA